MVVVLREKRKKRRGAKFGNRKVFLDGFVFDSEKEADRYVQLLLMQRGGDITRLEVHPVFDLEISHAKICDYEADFSYVDLRSGKFVVEDAKGYRTRVFIIKKKLMLALRGIDVKEV